jgi:hypothetical protein
MGFSDVVSIQRNGSTNINATSIKTLAAPAAASPAAHASARKAHDSQAGRPVAGLAFSESGGSGGIQEAGGCGIINSESVNQELLTGDFWGMPDVPHGVGFWQRKRALIPEKTFAGQRACC